MTTTGRTAKGGRGSAHLIRAILGFVGFMLSPFTPWNDAFVNVPLSVVLAMPLSAFVPFQYAYALAYTFTNVLGIALMFLSGKGVKLSVRDLLESAAVGILGYLVYFYVVLPHLSA